MLVAALVTELAPRMTSLEAGCALAPIRCLTLTVERTLTTVAAAEMRNTCRGSGGGWRR